MPRTWRLTKSRPSAFATAATIPARQASTRRPGTLTTKISVTRGFDTKPPCARSNAWMNSARTNVIVCWRIEDATDSGGSAGRNDAFRTRGACGVMLSQAEGHQPRCMMQHRAGSATSRRRRPQPASPPTAHRRNPRRLASRQTACRQPPAAVHAPPPPPIAAGTAETSGGPAARPHCAHHRRHRPRRLRTLRHRQPCKEIRPPTTASVQAAAVVPTAGDRRRRDTHRRAIRTASCRRKVSRRPCRDDLSDNRRPQFTTCRRARRLQRKVSHRRFLESQCQSPPAANPRSAPPTPRSTPDRPVCKVSRRLFSARPVGLPPAG